MIKLLLFVVTPGHSVICLHYDEFTLFAYIMIIMIMLSLAKALGEF